MQKFFTVLRLWSTVQTRRDFSEKQTSPSNDEASFVWGSLHSAIKRTFSLEDLFFFRRRRGPLKKKPVKLRNLVRRYQSNSSDETALVKASDK